MQRTASSFVRLSVCVIAAVLLPLSPLVSARSQATTSRPQAAKSSVRTEMLVSAGWLAQHLKDDEVIVIHVAREKSHYDAGHIPGARYLPWSDLVTTRDGIANELPPVEQLQQLFTRLGIGNKARVILYGDGSLLSATRAYFTLDYLGQGHRTALLDGGLEKWKADGRELSVETVNPAAREFVAVVHPEVVAGIDKARQYSTLASGNLQNTSLVDCRSEDQFLGDTAAPNGQRTGHIPGAVNLYWVKQLTSRESPVLLPVSDLQAMFEAAGVPPGGKVMTYCNSGVQASHAYFVAKYLGYETSMYDGSFSEWVKAENTKVVTGKSPK
ncbi:MAG: sulfurtransferase [Acidobacteriota bacterium]